MEYEKKYYDQLKGYFGYKNSIKQSKISSQ